MFLLLDPIGCHCHSTRLPVGFDAVAYIRAPPLTRGVRGEGGLPNRNHRILIHRRDALRLVTDHRFGHALSVAIRHAVEWLRTVIKTGLAIVFELLEQMIRQAGRVDDFPAAAVMDRIPNAPGAVRGLPIAGDSAWWALALGHCGIPPALEIGHHARIGDLVQRPVLRYGLIDTRTVTVDTQLCLSTSCKPS